MISRCGDFIFEISSIAPLENTVNLTGVAPGAKSSTLRLFADTTSTPKSELDALERFFESFTTNKTLLPTLVFLPLSRGFPERPFSLQCPPTHSVVGIGEVAIPGNCVISCSVIDDAGDVERSIDCYRPR